MSEPRPLLEGVKVISFGAFVAGNTASKLIAEMGADVLKVEPRSRPEVLRKPAYAIGEAFVEPSGSPNTVMYATLARGARSLAIDLESPDARPLFHRLVSKADIVIENFAGKTLDRWGCSYADLVRDNPRLVMLSVSGYGRTGPRASYLAYGSTMSSYLGLASAWRYTHGTITDYLTGATGALAAVAALQRARRSGEPCYVDVAQIDAVAPMLVELYAGPLNGDDSVPPEVNRVPGSWFSGVFAGAGNDAWLAVDIEDGRDWAALCQLLDRPDLIAQDAKQATALEAALRDALTEWAARQSPFRAMHVMQKAGLAAAPVQSSEDIWRDVQLRVRAFAERVYQPDLGTVTYPRSAQCWTKTPGRVGIPPARLGEHTFEVLREWLDVSAAELDDLVTKGAIFDAG